MNMASPVISIIVGVLCGILSGFGIGGGSILIIWLTVFVGMEQIAAQSTNLLYFLPTAAAALLIHIKRTQVVWRAVIPAAIAGCIASAIFSLISTTIEMGLLRKLFGIFLLLIGTLEILKKDTRDQT